MEWFRRARKRERPCPRWGDRPASSWTYRPSRWSALARQVIEGQSGGKGRVNNADSIKCFPPRLGTDIVQDALPLGCVHPPWSTDWGRGGRGPRWRACPAKMERCPVILDWCQVRAIGWTKPHTVIIACAWLEPALLSTGCKWIRSAMVLEPFRYLLDSSQLVHENFERTVIFVFQLYLVLMLRSP